MKRRALWIAVILAILLLNLPVSLAIPLGDINADSIIEITGDTNGDGIISFDEEGELVSMVQTRIRELGYFLFKPTGRYQSLTRSCMQTFQQNQTDESGAPMIADGTVGQQTLSILFSTRAQRAPIGNGVRFPSLRNGGGKTSPGQRVTWDKVKEKLTVNKTYNITDFSTGDVIEMKFTGGEMHAEMECASANDTTVFKSLFGDEFNYYKRPAIIEVGGEMIACSVQGQPHGEDTVSQNDMDGHICLFFEGSRSHVMGLGDIEHANNIRTASGM